MYTYLYVHWNKHNTRNMKTEKYVVWLSANKAQDNYTSRE